MSMQEITTFVNNRKSRFIEVVGERNAGPYMSSVLLAVANDSTGKLKTCDPSSIYVSALRAATLRLSVDPSRKQAYLVPFGSKATLIVGYKGLYDMAIRTGRYRYINVGKVFQGQEVITDQISGFIKIEGNIEDKTKVIGWIGAFEMMDGYAKVVYWTVEEIHAHKEKYSKGWNRTDSAWKTSTEAMEKKTVLIDLLNHWGYMDENDRAVLDEMEQEVIEAEAVDIPEDLDAAEAETVKRSEQENLAQLGFGG